MILPLTARRTTCTGPPAMPLAAPSGIWNAGMWWPRTSRNVENRNSSIKEAAAATTTPINSYLHTVNKTSDPDRV
jgi:hypothetical protein